MNKTLLVEFFDYTFWAFERLWGCLEHLAEADFTREVDYSLGSIRNQMVHVMSANTIWIHRLRDQPFPPHFDPQHYPTRAAVRAGWAEMQALVTGYLGAVSEAQLNEKVAWRWQSRNVSAESARWQIMLHVANHATDHRTQILTLLGRDFHAPTFEQDLLHYYVEKGG